jgi:hypothetical protein
MLASRSKTSLLVRPTVEQDCHICFLILRAIERYKYTGTSASVVRVGPTLIVKLGEYPILGLRSCRGSYHRLQIYLVSLLTRSLSLEESDAITRIGLPVLLAAKRQLRFDFLRAWLKWCDEHHRCNQHLAMNTSPTRLISVGDPDCPHYTPDKVRLVIASEGIRERYIALSHCWGSLTDDEKKAFCTTKENLDTRKNEFSVAELPKTFRDAIEVARKLRTPYLWIDSLCILQGDEKDWNTNRDAWKTSFLQLTAQSLQHRL